MAVQTSNVDASHWNREAYKTSMRKAEASAPELKLSSSGFRGSRFPQGYPATHLIFFFPPPGPRFLVKTNFEGMTSSIPSLFPRPPVATSSILQEKLLGRLLFLVGVIQLRF